MQRRYIAALVIGLGLGLCAIASQAVHPWSWSTTLWDNALPHRNDSYLFQGAQGAQPVRLVEQAYVLRAIHLLVEEGFAYLLIPPAICCAYVKLSKISLNSKVAKDVLESVKVSFWIVLLLTGACLIANVIDLFQANAGNLELRLMGVCSILVYLFVAFLFLLVPTLGLLSFIIRKWWQIEQAQVKV